MLKRAIRFRGRATWVVALPFVLVSLSISGLLLSSLGTGKASAKAFDFADPAFLGQWQLADKPIQDGSVTNRSWVWGPTFSEGKTEDYAEAPGGKRLVQYFDKARMEINNPNAPRDNKFFVTNGLLVTEMISGQIQTGDNSFVANPSGPANIPVAGDPDGNSVALLYSSFAAIASINGNNRAADQTQQVVINTLSKDGIAGQNPATGGYGVTNGYYESTLGHNIPAPFWNFLNQQGQVYSNGGLRNGQILEWQVAAGLPLTEAYWSRAVVGGQEKDVLVQMFQRRVLTYTPSNTQAYRVEMGNVGQHYYKWRYENQTTPQPNPTAAPPAPAPTPTPTAVPAPATPAPTAWNGPIQAQTVARPVIKVRPTDGDVWIVGENKGTKGIFASDSASNFSNVINLEPNGQGEKVSAEFDSSGNLHVVWQARNAALDGSLQTYYRRIKANGQPDGLRNLSAELIGNNSSGLPSLAFSPWANRLYLVQEENPSTVTFYESGDQGISWTNRQVLGTKNGNQTAPRVTGDTQGNVHVVWVRQNGYGNGNADVFGADRIGGNWNQLYNITNYNSQWSVPPGVGFTTAPSGDLYLSWISSSPGGTGVGVARYDLGSKSWQGRKDNISNISSSAFGRVRSTSVAVSSNGTLWVGYTAYDPNSGNGGSFYVASSNQGASWTENRSIINKADASDGTITAFNDKVYFTAVFFRQTFYAFRGQ